VAVTVDVELEGRIAELIAARRPVTSSGLSSSNSRPGAAAASSRMV
jgi:hypothetical protein